MTIVSRIVLACVLALPAFGSALAAEEDTLIERSMQASGQVPGQVLNYVQGMRPAAQSSAADRVRAHRAGDAQAYAPFGAGYETNDFGAGSQR